MQIPGINEAVTSVAAVWSIMRGRSEDVQKLDLSKKGYSSSFGAILYVFIFWLITPNSVRGLVNIQWTSTETLSVAYALLGLLGICVATALIWFTYAYVLRARAKQLGIEATVEAFVIVRNWSVLLITIVGALLEASLGWISGYVGWIITFWGIWVIYNAARCVTQASAKTSALIVGLEYLVVIGVSILLGLLFSILGGFVILVELLSALL